MTPFASANSNFVSDFKQGCVASPRFTFVSERAEGSRDVIEPAQNYVHTRISRLPRVVAFPVVTAYAIVSRHDRRESSPRNFTVPELTRVCTVVGLLGVVLPKIASNRRGIEPTNENDACNLEEYSSIDES